MRKNWMLVSLGDRRYRLQSRAGRTFGWIHGHAVGLSGFRDRGAAMRQAPALRRALDATLARHYPDRYRPVRDFSDLRLVHDGAYEWIAAGAVPIARVHRRQPGQRPRDVALELVLPSYASEKVTVASAAVLANTLCKQTEASGEKPRGGWCRSGERTILRTSSRRRRRNNRAAIKRTKERTHAGSIEAFDGSQPRERERGHRERLPR